MHIAIPEKDNALPFYEGENSIKKKIRELLDEFRKYSVGTMLISSLDRVYQIECDACKLKINRNARLLENNQLVYCENKDCKESYRISIYNKEIKHDRRAFTPECMSCKKLLDVPYRMVKRLKIHESLKEVCECGETNYVTLMAMQPEFARPNGTVNDTYVSDDDK